MAAKIKKMIVAPIDGSDGSLRSLDYLSLLYGTEHDVKVILLYVLPTLPPILIDESKKDKATARKLESLKKKNLKMAQSILKEAKEEIIGRGYDKSCVETVLKEKEKDTALEICTFAESRQADAILLNTRGRSRIQAFMMGETSRNVMLHSKICPVWIAKGTIRSKNVLVAVDGSRNALRAVDHAGFMLAGSDCRITLFHTKQNLRRFVPKELIEDAADLEVFWKEKAGQKIEPMMKKAKAVLLEAGLNEAQIDNKIVDGTRSPASDIISAAKRYKCGTIVLGHRGLSGIKGYFVGNVTRKVLDAFSNMSVWIVR